MDHTLTRTPTGPARIVVADHDGLFRSNLRHLLEAPPPIVAEAYGADIGEGFQVVAETADGEHAVGLAHTVEADLWLVDHHLPAMADVALLRALSSSPAAGRTVLLASDIQRSELADAIRAGVRGIVLKTAATNVLLDAIRSVLQGRCWLDHALLTDFIAAARPLIQSSHQASRGARLTRREREVLGLIVAGYANKDIARETSVTVDSIKHHLTRMYEKLGVSNRVELATLATEHGLLES
jgi:two-component system, NarL family, nitrate/nitrite response regulator NarL